MSTTNLETEWYLRDFFFRQSNKDRRVFLLHDIPLEMVNLYLRYRSVPFENISASLGPIFKKLSDLGAILNFKASSDDAEVDQTITLAGSPARRQCKNCFYVCYLFPAEPRKCLRCGSYQIQEFIQKHR